MKSTKKVSIIWLNKKPAQPKEISCLTAYGCLLSNPAHHGNAEIQLGTVQFPVGEVIRCAAGFSRFLAKSMPLLTIKRVISLLKSLKKIL